jgi:hypothetical protein
VDEDIQTIVDKDIQTIVDKDIQTIVDEDIETNPLSDEKYMREVACLWMVASSPSTLYLDGTIVYAVYSEWFDSILSKKFDAT